LETHDAEQASLTISRVFFEIPTAKAPGTQGFILNNIIVSFFEAYEQ
jgi:hypothetical protein